jgi:hypothetical protein
MNAVLCSDAVAVRLYERVWQVRRGGQKGNLAHHGEQQQQKAQVQGDTVEGSRLLARQEMEREGISLLLLVVKLVMWRRIR